MQHNHLPTKYRLLTLGLYHCGDELHQLVGVHRRGHWADLTSNPYLCTGEYDLTYATPKLLPDDESRAFWSWQSGLARWRIRPGCQGHVNPEAVRMYQYLRGLFHFIWSMGAYMDFNLSIVLPQLLLLLRRKILVTEKHNTSLRNQ